jgi:hypothetical protein
MKAMMVYEQLKIHSSGSECRCRCGPFDRPTTVPVQRMRLGDQVMRTMSVFIVYTRACRMNVGSSFGNLLEWPPREVLPTKGLEPPWKPAIISSRYQTGSCAQTTIHCITIKRSGTNYQNVIIPPTSFAGDSFRII